MSGQVASYLPGDAGSPAHAGDGRHLCCRLGRHLRDRLDDPGDRFGSSSSRRTTATWECCSVGGEAVAVGMLATMFVVSVAPKTREPIFASPTGRVVGTVMNNLGPVLPVEIRKVLAPLWDGGPRRTSPSAEHDAGQASPESTVRPPRRRVELAAAALPPPHEASSSSGPELPALPPLEAVPGEPSIRPAPRRIPRCFPPWTGLAVRPPRNPRRSAGPSARDGRRSSRRSPRRSMPSPDQKATNLRQLVNKDRNGSRGRPGPQDRASRRSAARSRTG